MNAQTPIRAATTGHPYSATCNCNECFETWLAMPEPSPEERKAMARRFMAIMAPSSGGELLTDHPVTFPDLDWADRANAEVDRQRIRRTAA